MSTNAPQVQRSQDDPFWIPRRVHGGLRHLRRVGRGKNRHYEFQGQEQGEVVTFITVGLLAGLVARHASKNIESSFAQPGMAAPGAAKSSCVSTQPEQSTRIAKVAIRTVGSFFG